MPELPSASSPLIRSAMITSLSQDGMPLSLSTANLSTIVILLAIMDRSLVNLSHLVRNNYEELLSL
jgi:hypothetical protein